MNIDTYALRTESSFTIFEFISEGKKGSIRKIIQFQETNEPGLYNLAFGDVNDRDEIDDLVISNNGDKNKVLATVITAIYSFFEKYPSAFVFATGSTRVRTRMYRIGMTKYHQKIIQDFNLYGLSGNNFYEFEPDQEYTAFLIHRKF